MLTISPERWDLRLAGVLAAALFWLGSVFAFGAPGCGWINPGRLR